MQRMLKMSRAYTLAEILSKIFKKKRRKIWDLIYDHGLRKYRFGANLIFANRYFAITACTTHTFIFEQMLTNVEKR